MNVRRTAAPLATAAVLALALTACGDDSSDTADDPAGTPSASASSAPPSTEESPTTDTSSEPAGSLTVPVYYVAQGPLGDRLVREFHAVTGTDPVTAAAAELAAQPLDPDYTSYADWVEGATVADGTISVTVADDPSVTDEAARDLAVQQVVYTVQAAAGQRLPVEFVDASGAPATAVADGPVEAADELDTLLLVNITDPAEGTIVSGSFTATGRASSFEANLLWEVRSGDEAVLDGFTTHGGDWMTGLGEWSVEVDVSSLEPGTYTFAALTDDPSGGEGPGASEDTKTIVVE
ncbi:Gmad2 immunoglobulin-like domain-containing protein [Nocardioides alkalitolerans]|uniref:Gmad2 immunoglobulin-like domain-containing protein n=1 Tax=Nocardioides alkalitolerans TaxID=281714 RepID=UPI0003F874FE|nr:Gmad2 immunoglobulin-like domain-containing protein [Nocardioides alkalitolerans]